MVMSTECGVSSSEKHPKNTYLIICYVLIRFICELHLKWDLINYIWNVWTSFVSLKIVYPHSRQFSVYFIICTNCIYKLVIYDYCYSINDINSFNLERIITVKGSIENMSKAEALISAKLRQSYENDLQAMAVSSLP